MAALLALMALMALAGSGARADSVKLGGQTVLVPSDTVESVVEDGRLSIRPFSPAKAFGDGFRFPVATGFGDSATYTGLLVHGGGLSFSKGKRSLVPEGLRHRADGIELAGARGGPPGSP